MKSPITWIDGVIGFYPKFNMHYSWVNGLFNFGLTHNFTLMLNSITTFFVFYAFRFVFSLYRDSKLKKNISISLVNFAAVVFLSGCLCSLSDLIFWGSSLDYILLEKLFIFDLKDCYLTIGEIVFFFIIFKFYDNNPIKILKSCFSSAEYKIIGQFFVFIYTDLKKIFL